MGIKPIRAVIGITGTLGAGKGTIVDHLVETWEFHHFSARQYLASRVKQIDLEVNRDTLVTVGNELRVQYGPGYVMEMLYQMAHDTGGVVILESIRTLGEIEILKAKPEPFYLFAVDAHQEIRYHRITKRASETDKISFERFMEQEAREMESDDPNKQNLRACFEKARYRFTNNGTVLQLCSDVDGALDVLGI